MAPPLIKRLLRSPEDIRSIRDIMSLPSTDVPDEYVTVTERATEVVVQTETMTEVPKVMQSILSQSAFATPPTPFTSTDVQLQPQETITSPFNGIVLDLNKRLTNTTDPVITTWYSNPSGEVLFDNFPLTSFAIIKSILLIAFLAIFVTATYKILWRTAVRSVKPKRHLQYMGSTREYPG